MNHETVTTERVTGLYQHIVKMMTSCGSAPSTFQIRYPEINSWIFLEFHKISWNLTKCTSSLRYQLYMMLLIPEKMLYSKCAFSILKNPQISWKFLNIGRNGSTNCGQLSIVCACVYMTFLVFYLFVTRDNFLFWNHDTASRNVFYVTYYEVG